MKIPSGRDINITNIDTLEQESNSIVGGLDVNITNGKELFDKLDSRYAAKDETNNGTGGSVDLTPINNQLEDHETRITNNENNIINLDNNKQDTLVSGQNIKTINGQDVTGSGDIVIDSNTSLPINDTDITVTNVNGMNNQSQFNSITNGQVISALNFIGELTNTDGSGGELVHVVIEGQEPMTITDAVNYLNNKEINVLAEDITISVSGYPDMNLLQTITLVASRLKDKPNRDELLYKRLLDVGFQLDKGFQYYDGETGMLQSFLLLEEVASGDVVEGKIKKETDFPIDLTRNVSHEIILGSGVEDNKGNAITDTTYFEKGSNSLIVKDASGLRKLSYGVSLFTNGSFTYDIKLIDQNDNVLDTKTITTIANDTTVKSWQYEGTSSNEQDEYRLTITEVDGDWQNGYVNIQKEVTFIGASVYKGVEWKIREELLPSNISGGSEELIYFNNSLDNTLVAGVLYHDIQVVFPATNNGLKKLNIGKMVVNLNFVNEEISLTDDYIITLNQIVINEDIGILFNNTTLMNNVLLNGNINCTNGGAVSQSGEYTDVVINTDEDLTISLGLTVNDTSSDNTQYVNLKPQHSSITLALEDI